MKKIGLIGCGAIAPIHIKAILATNEEIVCLCDSNIQRAQDLAIQFSLSAHIYDDFQTMLSQEQLDIIHVCTPHHLHKEMIVAAVKKGVHVLCEKPLCISIDEFREIKAVMQTSQVQVGVCFQNRYNPTTPIVKELLKGEEVESVLGEVLWHRKGDYYTKSSWRGKRDKEGGSVLINQAIHTLDLLIYLFGQPSEIYTEYANKLHQAEIETEDEVRLECYGKQPYTLYATTNSEKDKPATITIVSKNKIIQFDSQTIVINGKAIQVPFNQREEKFVWGDGHLALIKDFYIHVINQQQFSIDINEAYKSLAVVLEAYNSNGKKTAVSYAMEEK